MGVVGGGQVGGLRGEEAGVAPSKGGVGRQRGWREGQQQGRASA